MKLIAAANNLWAKAGDNIRRRATWIELLTTATAGTVTAEEFSTFENPAADEGLTEAEENREIEGVLLNAINAASDAEQAAIMAEDLEAARSYSEQVDRLLEQYTALIELNIQHLAIRSNPIPEAVNIVWASPFVGSVSINYGETFRAFRIVDAATDSPIVKLHTSAGVEIDSRWVTTSGNRYIKAVLAALPERIAAIERAMFSGSDFVKSSHGVLCSGGANDEGPRGGKGDGSDRGRRCLDERGGGRVMSLTYDVPDGF